jgi:uncharacterized protein (TIGR03437 family)
VTRFPATHEIFRPLDTLIRLSNLGKWLRLTCILLAAAPAAICGEEITVPNIDTGGIVDAASFATDHKVAAGSMVAIFGEDLAGVTTLAPAVPLPFSLADDVSVTFDGMPAAIQFVSAGQINAQVPWNVMPPGVSGTVNVVVTRGGISSFPEPVLISQVAPGTYQASGHAFAINVTDPASPRYGSFAAPVGSLPGYAAFPAQIGDAVLVYASGLGAVDLPINDGSDSLDTTRRTLAMPLILIGNVPAIVTFSGLSPQYPGVYQVNFVVPPVPSGNAIPLQIQVAGLTTTSTTTIAIQ